MENNRELIDKLESSTKKEDAFFAFCYEENNQDNEHIKANKEGLKSFALFLLRIVFDLEPKNRGIDKNIFPIDNSLELSREGISINYIKLFDAKKSDYKVEPEPKENWKDKITKFGCIVVLSLLVFCGFVGIYTIVNWIV